MKQTVLAWGFGFWLLTLSSTAWAAVATGPRVVVSIKPLHSLVAGVMQGVGEPALLLQGASSPHGYVLRPSEARLLNEAQLIVWIGPQLEGFLEKPLRTLGDKARQLVLARELAPRLLPVRTGGNWEDAGHGHDHGHGHGRPGDRDQHLWLDPLLAKQIVEKTAAALATLDPAHQAQYRHNAAQLQQRLDQLHEQLKARLTPVQKVPYVVFHDAYQYFEASYGLTAVGSLTIDPERKPGAKRIREIRQRIQQLQARCVFSEPQFEPRLVATVTEGSLARSGVLDPIGADLAPGPEAYFQLLTALADNLVTGLRN